MSDTTQYRLIAQLSAAMAQTTPAAVVVELQALVVILTRIADAVESIDATLASPP